MNDALAPTCVTLQSQSGQTRFSPSSLQMTVVIIKIRKWKVRRQGLRNLLPQVLTSHFTHALFAILLLARASGPCKCCFEETPTRNLARGSSLKNLVISFCRTGYTIFCICRSSGDFPLLNLDNLLIGLSGFGNSQMAGEPLETISLCRENKYVTNDTSSVLQLIITRKVCLLILRLR